MSKFMNPQRFSRIVLFVMLCITLLVYLFFFLSPLAGIEVQQPTNVLLVFLFILLLLAIVLSVWSAIGGGFNRKDKK